MNALYRNIDNYPIFSLEWRIAIALLKTPFSGSVNAGLFFARLKKTEGRKNLAQKKN